MVRCCNIDLLLCEESGVLVATSNDIPGLVLEAEDLRRHPGRADGVRSRSHPRDSRQFAGRPLAVLVHTDAAPGAAVVRHGDDAGRSRLLKGAGWSKVRQGSEASHETQRDGAEGVRADQDKEPAHGERNPETCRYRGIGSIDCRPRRIATVSLDPLGGIGRNRLRNLANPVPPERQSTSCPSSTASPNSTTR